MEAVGAAGWGLLQLAGPQLTGKRSSRTLAQCLFFLFLGKIQEFALFRESLNLNLESPSITQSQPSVMIDEVEVFS